MAATGVCGICAVRAATVDAAVAVGKAAGPASRVGAPSGEASSRISAGAAEEGVAEADAAAAGSTTGASTNTPAEGTALFCSPMWSGPVLTLPVQARRDRRRGQRLGGISKKTAIPGVATIVVAARPSGRPSERRDVSVARLNVEALAGRIGVDGVCCSARSGGMGEMSPGVSNAGSRAGCNSA